MNRERAQMTGRERVRAAIERKPLDRVPIYCDELFADTLSKWCERGMPATRPEQEDFFDYDCTELFVDTSMRFEERLLEETRDQIKVSDKYGLTVTRNKHVPGAEYHEHPIKTPEDWGRYKDRWSLSPNEPARVHEVSYAVPLVKWPSWNEAKRILDEKKATGRHITLRAYGHWEILWRLRGYTEALMDLVTNPSFVKEICDCYTAFLLGILSTTLERGMRVDSFFILDDHGSNAGLLFSPDIIRSMILPQYKRINDFLCAENIYFFMHSCGDICRMIPEYLDAGVIALNPLQATAMDVVDLKRTYGDRLTFIGNIDSRTMYDRDTVLAEATRKIPVAARGGGYIYSCDHSIPATVDLETYLELLHVIKCVSVET